MRPKQSTFVVDSEVARYITAVVNSSDKTQAQIAQEVGFEKPNVVSMIKSGRMKLPIGKVRAFATALDVDPVALLKIVLKESHPEVWSALNQILGIEKTAFSKN